VWFGEWVPGGGSNPAALKLTDRAELVRVGFASHLAKGAQIVLDSCSTGHGGASANNIANMLGGLVPWASVDAPLDPGSVWNVALNADGTLNGVEYNRWTYKYHRPAAVGR
jgi:hypothetical protein